MPLAVAVSIMDLITAAVPFVGVAVLEEVFLPFAVVSALVRFLAVLARIATAFVISHSLAAFS